MPLVMWLLLDINSPDRGRKGMPCFRKVQVRMWGSAALNPFCPNHASSAYLGTD